MRVIRSASVLLVILLAGCADEAPKPRAPIPSAPPAVFSGSTARVAVAPVTLALEPRRSIGTIYRNVDCWVRVRSILPEDLPDAVTIKNEIGQALKQANLTVSGADSDDLARAGAVDYLLVPSIPSAHVDFCVNSFFNDGPADIDAQVAISWQLWSVKDRRLAYETTSTGTARVSDPQQRIAAGFLASVDDGTRQLLETTAAQQYLTFGHVLAPPSAGAGPVPTGGSAPIPQPVSGAPMQRVELPPILVPVKAAYPAGTPIDRAASRTATLSLGSGAGLILGNGYALTASVLAETGAALTVTLPDGRAVGAHAVRSDATVGVSLLQLDSPLTAVLPLQPRRNAVGDKIYGVSDGKLIAGRFTSVRGAGGHDVVTLDGALVGGPVLDPTGTVIGILLPNGGFASVGTIFRALSLGAELGDE